MKVCPNCSDHIDSYVLTPLGNDLWRCSGCGATLREGIVSVYDACANMPVTMERVTPKVTWSKDKANAALAPYREARQLALYWGESPTGDLATLFLHANRIPGMCPNEKIYHLYRIATDCNLSGDVVEIGTWWGKSALVVLLLARRYGIGNVLCVDPWRDEELIQGVPHVDEASAALSADEAFEVFKMNLAPYATAPRNGWDDEPQSNSAINFVRATSVDANEAYRSTLLAKGVRSDAFEWTYYDGRIALLHIDGNHAYDKVKQDIALWAPLVVPGGWVVIDDYDWRHGDGPRRAADEFIAENGGCHRSFVAGGAMFVQFNKKE